MNHLITKKQLFNELKREYRHLYKDVNSQVREALKISDRYATRLADKLNRETGLSKIRAKMKMLCKKEGK